jgi:HEAT repeat protein
MIFMTYIPLGKRMITGCVCLALAGIPLVFQSQSAQAATQSSASNLAEVNHFLMELRSNRNHYSRAKAATELGLLGHPAALEQLHISLISDMSEQVRINAVGAIARINQKKSVHRLWNAMLVNRKRTDVQIAIVVAIGDMGKNSTDMVPRILQLLNSPNMFMREAAIDALWKIGDHRASKYLVRLLKKESEITVKVTLCRILPDFKDPQAMPVLEKLSRNPEEKPDVRALAQEALDKMEEMGLKAPPPPPAPKKKSR